MVYNVNLVIIYDGFQNMPPTCMTGKMSPTARLPVQLTKTATAMAAGRDSCANTSPVMSQGMDPRVKMTLFDKSLKIQQPLLKYSSPNSVTLDF